MPAIAASLDATIVNAVRHVLKNKQVGDVHLLFVIEQVEKGSSRSPCPRPPAASRRRPRTFVSYEPL
jgi:hypothetical protein